MAVKKDSTKDPIRAEVAQPGTGVAVHEPTAATLGAQEFNMVLRHAIDSKADPAVIERMMTLRQNAIEFERKLAREDRLDANKSAFTRAMSAFRSEPIIIQKTKQVGFKSKKEGAADTSYKHAELADVVRAVVPFLSKHGLRHSWHPRQDGQRIYVRCVVEHIDGHSEAIELEGAPDNSGNKNSIQAVGSTITYLQRYSLLAILGLATENEDDDGRGAADPVETPEEIEAREKASAIVSEWLGVIRETDTLDDLIKRKDECKTKYGGTDFVPKELRDAFVARTAELRKGAK